MKNKEKLQKTIDKMQGLKTYCVVEYKTGSTFYTVKAKDEDEALTMVQDRKPGYDDNVDYGSDGSVDFEVKEVTW